MKLFDRLNSQNPLDINSWEKFEAFLYKTEQGTRHYSNSESGPKITGPIVIFGAAITGVQLFLILAELGLKVDYFCDNNPNMRHTYVQHLYVLAPEDLEKLENPLILIASRWGQEIKAQLSALNLRQALVLTRDETDFITGRYLAQASSFYLNHLAELKEVYSSLADAESQYAFINAIKARLLLYEQSFYLFSTILSGNQYWGLPQFRAVEGAVLADIGAGRGETLETFLYNNPPPFKHLYAFEPDSGVYSQLATSIQRLADSFDFEAKSITAVNCGLGAKEETGSSFSVHQNQAGFAGDEFSLQISTLDKEFAHERVDIIKADIEGYELDMLKGGQGLLKARRPRLALSMYHRPEDFFTLPLYIMAQVPAYKLAVRHHSTTWYETVLYAWVEE